jgi:hypothetical protein
LKPHVLQSTVETRHVLRQVNPEASRFLLLITVACPSLDKLFSLALRTSRIRHPMNTGEPC